MTRKKSLIIAPSFFLLLLGQFHHFKAVVRTERHTLAAMDAYVGVNHVVQENGIHRAGFGTFAAANAQLLFLKNAAVPALGKRSGRACFGTRGRLTGQTDAGFEARG